MAKLETGLRLAVPDDIYQAMTAMLEAVGDEAGPSAFAALALTLANQIGDDETVLEAIELVKGAFAAATPTDAKPILVSEALKRFFDQHPVDGDVVA